MKRTTPLMSKNGALGWAMLSVTARSGGPAPRFPGPSDAMGFCVKKKGEKKRKSQLGVRKGIFVGHTCCASGDVHSRGLDGGRTDIAENSLGKIGLDCTRVSVEHAHQPS
jgi:hypothetical protein